MEAGIAKVTKAMARELARSVSHAEFCGDDVAERWGHVRDQIDELTGGDLDCTQLDLLTDWVVEALPK